MIFIINNTSGICKSLRNTFETYIYTSSDNDYNCNYGSPARTNIWKNVI
jgi:hypothetical protein